MKIVLIGPVYPYKGGIAHYTGLLCRALRERHDVVMISYKMQYPRLLFKKEQKDYTDKGFQVSDAAYWLNTANPFNIISVARRIRRLAPDLLILQWWHPYFAPCYYLLLKAVGRVPVVFTCHNVFPHERFPLDRFLSRMALCGRAGYIVHSHMDEDDLKTFRPDAPCVVTPHPSYNAFRMQGMSREQARGLLRMDAHTPMLLFFGFVREYKGLTYLLDAMPSITAAMPGLQLWVVGDFGQDRERYLRQIHDLALEERVVPVEGYVPDREVEKYFAAADLVVCPYISATQSGIVQIAYGFEKPVIVTEVGGLPEVVQERRTGYIVPPGNPEAIADAVLRFYGQDAGVDWANNIRKEAETFSWETMTERIERLASMLK